MVGTSFTLVEGGSQFIRAGFGGSEQQQKSRRSSGRVDGFWKMAPASLVFTWFLFTLRMVASAAGQDLEEEGELSAHITPPGTKS